MPSGSVPIEPASTVVAAALPFSVIGMPPAMYRPADDQTDRQHHVEHAPPHVDVEVAQLLLATQPANHGHAAARPIIGPMKSIQVMKNNWLKYDRWTSPE